MKSPNSIRSKTPRNGTRQEFRNTTEPPKRLLSLPPGLPRSERQLVATARQQPAPAPLRLPICNSCSFFSCAPLLCLLWIFLLASPAPAQNFEIDAQQFDQWIFSNLQNSENARRVLGERIETEIGRISLTIDLTESQQQKIRLAGKGDIKRFFDDVEQAHRDFEKMQAAGEINQQNFNDVYQLAMPLQQRLSRGLFDKDSLLRKVARGSVDQLQAKEIQEREARLNRLKTNAAIAAVIVDLGRQFPMLHAQRQALRALLTEKVKIKDPSHQYANFLVMYEMSELPEKKLEAIFDKAQLKALKKNFEQAAAMKQTLQRMGMLDE